MNPTGKKLIALFLVFSFLMLPTSLYAKKRGAKLIVIKKDGGQIEGELITVKPNSLLLLNTEGKDVSVDVEEIKVIKIVYKKLGIVGRGALGGLLGGAVFGAGMASMIALMFGPLGGAFGGDGGDGEVPWGFILRGGAIGASILAIVGAVVGAVVKPVATIKIEGKSDKKIKKNLDWLRKKARIRDYK